MSTDFNPVPEAALTGSLRDYRAPEGPDLISRISGFYRPTPAIAAVCHDGLAQPQNALRGDSA